MELMTGKKWIKILQFIPNQRYLAREVFFFCFDFCPENSSIISLKQQNNNCSILQHAV